MSDPQAAQEHVWEHAQLEQVLCDANDGPLEHLEDELGRIGGTFGALSYAVGAKDTPTTVLSLVRLMARCLRMLERLGYPDPCETSEDEDARDEP